MKHAITRLGLLLLLVLAVVPARAQLLEQFEPKVTTFTLDNGLRFVVVERHEAPVVSFQTYVDVGAVDEPVGLTGIAHMFEHMAFKGSTAVGTTDIEGELIALEREEALFQELRKEKAKGPMADEARIAELQQAFDTALEEAKSFVNDAEYDNILTRNGAVGINAGTSADATFYFYSLPSNKIELWFALESERFVYPVLREFYVERDVVKEERRMRVESQPVGRLIEEVVTTAFAAHPYRDPIVGYPSDLDNLSRTEALDFYDKYYNASNMVMAIVGDVDPAEARRLAEKYFSRIPAGEKPPRVPTVELDQRGERRVIIREQSQPFVIIGYKRPSTFDAADPVYDVLTDVLQNGRTSRFHQNLVETQLALGAGVFSSFPGGKYPNLYLLLGIPNQGVTPDSLEQAMYAELERIKDEGITAEELERAKTRARAGFVQQLNSNSGLAMQLSTYEMLTGDWRNLFRRLDALDAVTVDDVQRVARETFQANRRTVGLIVTDTDA